MNVPDEDVAAAIETLRTVPCTFWACQGPDEPFEHMVTCSLCQTIQDMESWGKSDAQKVE